MRICDIPQMTKRPATRFNVDWSFLEQQLEHWSRYGLDLDPDFQRGHVWTPQQQVAYVEYQLRGGQSGKDIYFNQARWNTPIQLVDGKQRLAAVRRFLNDEITAFGLKRSEYEDDVSWEHGFIFYLNDLKSRQDVLQWYLDMNTGGTQHSDDEIASVRLLLEQARATAD